MLAAVVVASVVVMYGSRGDVWQPIREAEDTMRWGGTVSTQVVSSLQKLSRELRPTNVTASALFTLGEILRIGCGKPQNTSAALEHYKASAKLGNASAQFTLSNVYHYGLYGQKQNEGKAVLYEYFSALGGDLGAIMTVGNRCESNVNVLVPTHDFYSQAHAWKRSTTELQRRCELL